MFLFSQLYRLIHYLLSPIITAQRQGPSHLRVRQHTEDRVIEKWDWEVTSCWSENVVLLLGEKPSGFQLYHALSQYFKTLRAHDGVPAVSRECLKCKASETSSWLNAVDGCQILLSCRRESGGKRNWEAVSCDSLAMTTFSRAMERCTCSLI